jgi:hypothetical protein
MVHELGIERRAMWRGQGRRTSESRANVARPVLVVIKSDLIA